MVASRCVKARLIHAVGSTHDLTIGLEVMENATT